AQPGERWLDLATGTGAVARKAARAGAQVTGIDLSPALIETAKQMAAEEGLDIDFRVGDCENLEDVETGSFDIVTSTCGVMFAPNQEATASELARVLRPGGRLAMVNWTPEGGVGELFQIMKPFQPPPPEGVKSPFEWGKRERVQELLGDAFDLNIEDHVSTLVAASGEEYWQLFVTSYGPTKTLAESLDDEQREELHRSWVEFFDGNYRVGDHVEHPRQYLLVLGTRR
ncbi:MAG TPA: class I SAM-dependent methyltransferase, partial [Gaiellaceae bacterium]|nr:class I SAM-dependent methyltransferase [Gaiellaceae bacterium]